MKQTITLIYFLVFFTFTACKNYSKNQPGETRTDSLINNPGSVADKAYEKGARLFAANDCITCHSIDKKMFGPPLIQIAARYHNDEKLAEYLANSVLKGSKGIFGDHAMTPHPNLNYNDIIEMDKYILSLRPTQ